MNAEEKLLEVVSHLLNIPKRFIISEECKGYTAQYLYYQFKMGVLEHRVVITIHIDAYRYRAGQGIRVKNYTLLYEDARISRNTYEMNYTRIMNKGGIKKECFEYFKPLAKAAVDYGETQVPVREKSNNTPTKKSSSKVGKRS